MGYKSLTLILDHGDQIYLDPSDVIILELENLKSNITIKEGRVSKWCKASKLSLVLGVSANIEYEKLGVKRKVFNRLSVCPDITSIIIEYEDGNSEQIFVEWDPLTLNGTGNKYQESSMVGESLLISISPTPKEDIKYILSNGLEFHLDTLNTKSPTLNI